MSKNNQKPTVNKAMKLIAELSDQELVLKDAELRKEKFNLRAQQKSGQLKNTASIRTARRNLARVLTEQKKRSAAESAK